jgi:protein-disulfide isomerase/uncharacterized membrane protein
VFCALGLAVSGLSTRDHLRFKVTGGTQAGVCAALVDSGCREAHSSAAAEILGVPISHYGSAFYLAGAGLAVVALVIRKRRSTALVPAVAQTLGLMGLGAVGYSIYLASLLIRSGEACPFCIALYAVNAAMLVLALVWWLRGERRVVPRAFVLPGVVAAGVGGVFFAATTPFLLIAGATNPGGKPLTPFVLPERIPSKGAPSAAGDLVEFSDLECPHCRTMHRTVSALFEERGPARLRVRFVNFPLDRACNPHVARTLHPTACLAARGGLCAQEQGLFWPFAEQYFNLQATPSSATVLDVARGIGADVERFSLCLDAERTVRALADDIALAHAAGVRATPTILVNGWTFEGALPREQLLRILGDTTPCGCDQRSSDGTCGAPPAGAAWSSTEQQP